MNGSQGQENLFSHFGRRDPRTTFAASIAAVAAADPVNNHRFPVDNSSLNMTGVTGVCSFPVNSSVVTSRQYVVKTSTASDGTVTSRIMGSLALAITNAATGATMTVNDGGPERWLPTQTVV